MKWHGSRRGFTLIDARFRGDDRNVQRTAVSGFTLVELLIVVALIAILAGIMLVAADPVQQLQASRNSERSLNLQTILNAVRQNMADQGNESFSCASGPLPTSSAMMTSASGTHNYNIAPCLVPSYALTLPFDPNASSSYFTSVSNYNLGYTIFITASGTVTVAAPYAELGKTISVTR